MKYIILLLLSIIAVPVFAQTQTASQSSTEVVLAEMQTFTPEQKAQLAEAAKDIRLGHSYAASAKEWAEVGSSIGKGLVATANEMGVAVNDFARTPVGKIAVALIVWKVAGGDIIHVVVALFACGLLFAWYKLFVRTYGVFDANGKFTHLDLNADVGDLWEFSIKFLLPCGLFITIITSLFTI